MIHSNETQGDLMQATESGAEINKKNWCQFRVRMIWDDKNLGRGYNSTIGHTAVIGLSTGKVLEYITKINISLLFCCETSRKNTKTARLQKNPYRFIQGYGAYCRSETF